MAIIWGLSGALDYQRLSQQETDLFSEFTEKPHEFSTAHVLMPNPIRSKMKSFADDIPEADLVDDGIEDDPHITVKYGIHTDDIKEIASILKGQKAIKAVLGKVSLFTTNPDFDVIKIDVISRDLGRLNKLIAKSTDCTDTHPVYHPHATLAYVKKGCGDQYIGDDRFKGIEIIFNHVVFSDKSGKAKRIPLERMSQKGFSDNLTSQFYASQFADNPWADALQAFLAKRTIDAAAFEEWLKAIDAAYAAGAIPDLQVARDAAYNVAFTMIREADSVILDRVRDKVTQAIRDGLSPGDFIQDLDNIYRSLGLREQDGWYARLVYENAMNRAWQQGRDAISHDIDPVTGKLIPKSWVWGYEWRHDAPEHPRPTHLAMDGHQAPHDDPVWDVFGPPPIAHRCRCARYTIGRTRAEQVGLDEQTTFTAPSVSASALESAGYKPEDVAKYAGKPVTSLVNILPGERFPRGEYDIETRYLINPSGVK